MPAHDVERYKLTAIRTLHSRVRFVIMQFSRQQRAIYALMKEKRDSEFRFQIENEIPGGRVFVLEGCGVLRHTVPL